GSPLDLAAIGDLLTLDFEDPGTTSVLRDRSGAGRHAERNDAMLVADAERGGQVLRVDGHNVFVVGDRGLASDGPLTIEAWIRPNANQTTFAVFGNYVASQEPRVDFSLEVDQGLLSLITGDGATGEVVSAMSGERIVSERWTHVAVSWDGQVARYYIDGEPAGEMEHRAAGPERAEWRHFRVGRRTGGEHALDGAIDDLKVSSWAKSAADIRYSMEVDAAALVGRCGDLLNEGAEVCDGSSLCCDPTMCQPLEQDDACSEAGGTCEGGRCVLPAAEPVNDGLVVLYEFDALNEGAIIEDESGISPALDLKAGDGLIMQEVGHLDIIEGTLLATEGSAEKVTSSCVESDELTLEAWVKPANQSQGGPARVVTLSVDSQNRNFTLGQEEDMWIARVRSTGSDKNGKPMVVSSPGDAAPLLTHVVVTVEAERRRMYVDGRLRMTSGAL